MNMQILNSERGVATLIALLMMGMLLLIGLAALSTSDDEVTIAGNEMQEMKAFYAAEAGLEKATSILQTYYDSTGAPPSCLPVGNEDINDCVVAYSVEDGGPVEQRPLTQGSLAGLNAQVKSFSANSIGVSPTDGSKVAMSVSFESALVPIFQFAVFYGQDLEIDPGPNMSLIGRVHSNGNMYLNPYSDLTMDSYVTASGKILVGAKGSDPLKPGDIKIKDAHGNYVDMKQGGTTFDNDYGDWYDSSVSRWGGRVQDEAHGQSQLNVPLAGSDDPHKLIERATGNPDSYENKATLRIIDGVVLRQDAGGAWQDVTASMVADGVISYSADKFWDDRDGQWVDATELDVGAMYDHGYAPENGVVYFSDDISGGSEFPALRLNNAAELDDGLTIACENPLYTKGDYNSVDKKPASFLSDAYTVMSASFDDSKSTMSKWNRKAQSTTVNASYVTGGVETGPGVESGGFHNLPRFLEVWSGKTFSWKGSSVHIWYSEQATAPWRSESGGYYSAPSRNWEYDTDLDDPANHPPETPTVRVFQRTGWKQEFVGFELGEGDPE